MVSTMYERFYLSKQDAELLRRLGVDDPYHDHIPDEIAAWLASHMDTATTAVQRQQYEHLLDYLLFEETQHGWHCVDIHANTGRSPAQQTASPALTASSVLDMHEELQLRSDQLHAILMEIQSSMQIILCALEYAIALTDTTDMSIPAL